ncbi:hypothetical protein ACQ4LE_000763 [Meloidogyne hapla]
MSILPVFNNKILFEPINIIEENEEKGHLIKLEYLQNYEGKENNYFINICIKFKNKGKYLLILIDGIFDISIAFQLFFNVENEMTTECAKKTIENISLEEKQLLNKLKLKINCFLIKIEEKYYENGIFVDPEPLLNKYSSQCMLYFVVIYPLIDDGIYEFYLDLDGNIKEKSEEDLSKITSKNIIKNYLYLREIDKKANKKLYYGDWQKFFYFNFKYFEMNEKGISKQVIEENKEKASKQILIEEKKEN